MKEKRRVEEREIFDRLTSDELNVPLPIIPPPDVLMHINDFSKVLYTSTNSYSMIGLRGIRSKGVNTIRIQFIITFIIYSIYREREEEKESSFTSLECISWERWMEVHPPIWCSAWEMVTQEIPFHPHVFVSIPLLLTYISDSFPSDSVNMRYSSGIRREYITVNSSTTIWNSKTL